MSLLLMQVAFALCSFEDSYDGDFKITDSPQQQTTAVLELWPHQNRQWLDSMLKVVEKHNIPVSVVVPMAENEAIKASLFPLQSSKSAEIVLHLSAGQVPTDVPNKAADLKLQLKKLSRYIGKPHTVIGPIHSRANEALLYKAGFKALFNTEAPPTAPARIASHFEHQPGLAVVLGSGPYLSEPCVGDPRVDSFTPKAADRARQALLRAQGEERVVVRIGIDGLNGHPEDALVLDKWLTSLSSNDAIEWSLPSPAVHKVWTELKARSNRKALHKQGIHVASADIVLAAEALRDVEQIPRELPGHLNPTQAHAAFLAYLADPNLASFRLKSMSGPKTLSASTITAGTEVNTKALLAVARELHAYPPKAIPSAMPVDGKLLNAAEWLSALAAAVRGDESIVVSPVSVVEPNEEGLGWGHSVL